MSKTIEARIRRLAGEANAITSKADGEGRALSAEETVQVMDRLKECGELHSGLQASAADRKRFSSQINQFSHIGMNEDPADETPMTSKVKNFRKVASSPGALFVNSDEYKALLTSKGNSNWNKVKVQSNPVGMDRLLPLKGSNLHVIQNALVTGSSEELLGSPTTSAGVLVEPAHLGMMAPTYARELTIRDLLTTIPVSTDTVDYTFVASVTNNAAAVREAANSTAPHDDGDPGPLTAGNPGGYKPESAITFDEASEKIRTFAHTMPVTKKALADVPQIRVIIDTFLRYGLEEEVEDQLLTGNGTGENLLGLFAAAREETAPGAGDGIQVMTSDESMFHKAKRAITRVRLARGGPATAHLMHPNTADEFYLAQDGEQRFRAGDPFNSDPNSPLWRKPIVESEAVPDDGTVMTANFRQGLYFDREESSITATDSHMDFFVRNLVMILAETRGGFGIQRPQSFVKWNINPDGASV